MNKRIIVAALALAILCLAGVACAQGHVHDDRWTAWNSDNSLPTDMQNAGKSFYLTKDVTLTGSWDAPYGTTLCLNGHSVMLSSSATGSVITIGYGSTFTLCDCVGGGRITGGKGKADIYGNAGGGVYVGGGTFNMYGGIITGNTVDKGASTASKPTGKGGGVYVSGGTFNMYGGSIVNNTADEASGVYCYECTVYLSGGTIAQNMGGGVYGVGFGIRHIYFYADGKQRDGSSASVYGKECLLQHELCGLPRSAHANLRDCPAMKMSARLLNAIL